MSFLYNPATSAIVGVAFWIFVSAVVVAGIWYYQSKNREKQKTIRLAIEKGVPLDAATIESLDKPSRQNPNDYAIGGYITLIISPGLLIFAFLIEKVEAQAFYPLLGAAVLCALVGISLIFVANMVKRWNREQDNGRN